MSQPVSHAELVAIHAELVGQLSNHDRDRFRRALSWIERAELAHEIEVEEKFLFYWIAFTAAYSGDQAQHAPDSFEPRLSNRFFRQILLHDRERVLRTIMVDQLNSAIEVLVGNRFLYQPYWDNTKQWKTNLRAEVAEMRTALRRGYVAPTFRIVLRRLHVLRNQIIHGGATWRSEVNRPQLHAGLDIMSQVTPAIVRIMLRQHARGGGWWPPVSWPRLESDESPQPTSNRVTGR